MLYENKMFHNKTQFRGSSMKSKAFENFIERLPKMRMERTNGTRIYLELWIGPSETRGSFIFEIN